MQVQLDLDGTLAVGPAKISLREMLVLLESIARQESLQGAATDLGMSYRSAWGKLAALEKALGRQLVQRVKGHGTVLAASGSEMLTLLAASKARLAAPLSDERRRLERELMVILAAHQPNLGLAASHDPLLVRCIADMPGVDLTIAGSQQALELLRSGAAAAAGFHFGDDRPPAGSIFAALFTDPTFKILRLFKRQQGLMMAAGNPHHITALADLTKEGVRFINRQRGSGTRAWFDRLLAEQEIEPGAIRGYATEEFTHQAVAALIASGAADAGMGVRNVADRFELAFTPIGWETYCLAVAADLVDDRVDAIAAAVRKEAGKQPGYSAARA